MKLGRTVARGWRWLRSRTSTNAMILLYHRICNDTCDPFGLSVTPELFESHIRVLTERYRLVPLATLGKDVANGTVAAGSVAITFDDGYEDNLRLAAPILRQFGAPATVFVVSGRRAEEYWWDGLVRLLMGATGLPGALEVLGRRFDVPLEARTAASARKALLRRIHGAMMERPLAEIREALQSIASQLDDPPATPRHRSLTATELLRLAAQDDIEIGAHTASHPVLSKLGRDQQRQEIAGSKAELEALLRRPVISFSYPFGQSAQYDSASVAEVRAAGFSVACIAGVDTVRVASDPLRLPRLWVRNIDAPQFARTLRSWMRV